jgi:hypothetical protein
MTKAEALLAYDRFDIDHHIVLRKLDEDGRQEVWRRLGHVPAVSAGWQWPTIHDMRATHAVVEIGTDVEPGAEVPYPIIQHPMHLVVDALRLAADGFVYPLGEYTRFAEFGAFLRALMPTGIVRPGPRHGGWAVGETVISEESGLTAIWASLRNREMFLTQKQLARLDIALQRLRYAYDRGGADDRLIDSWIGLEALFLHDAQQELSYRAALRIARTVGTDEDERVQLYQRLRKLYDVRSKVAHGASSSTPELADEIMNVLRRALVIWLHPDTLREGPDMDSLLLA